MLESRLRHLDLLTAKQNLIGAAQAKLAIAVAEKFIAFLIESGEDMRVVLDAANRVSQIALDSRLSKVAFDFGFELLAAVPSTRIESPAFRSKRWPQVVALVGEKARQHAARAERSVRRPTEKSSSRNRPKVTKR